MNQLGLRTEAHARRRDPNTSRAAATHAEKFAGSQADRVLACLKRFGPQGKTKISKRTGLTGVQVDRRLPDLKAQGLALPTHQTEPSDAGVSERIWVAV
jgi:predicted ArsR family transcriptional regulator